MTNYLTHKSGKNVSAQLPLQVNDVTQASDRFSPPVETVTFNSAAAAGSTGSNALDKSPIMNLTGSKVGSYWGEDRNRIYKVQNTGLIGTLTETATAATIVITDNTNVLDELFETTSGNRRYILKAIDSTGAVLYGWIGDITVSGVAYTIPVHNAVTGGAQSWIGTLGNFDNTAVRTVEIYSYESSFSWVTGTVLTEEVSFDPEIRSDASKLKEFYDSLTDGQYGVDYTDSVIHFKKATTGTSDTCNYTTRGGVAVVVSGTGGSSTLVDDAAFTVASSEVTPVGFLADETASDSVDEGDIGAPRMTLNRRIVTAGNLLDDGAFGVGTDYITPMGALVDDTTPDSADEGDIAVPRMSATRILYTQGRTAHDTAIDSDENQPLVIGARAVDPTSLPTAVAEGDVSYIGTSLQQEVLCYLSRLISGEDQTNNVLKVVNTKLASSSYSPTRFVDFGSNATLNVKSSSGNVYSLACHNENASDRYIQLHNTATTPTVGGTPLYSFLVPTNQQTVIGTDFFTQEGANFTNGIAFAFSTTKDTYTAGAAGDQSTIVLYI